MVVGQEAGHGRSSFSELTLKTPTLRRMYLRKCILRRFFSGQPVRLHHYQPASFFRIELLQPSSPRRSSLTPQPPPLKSDLSARMAAYVACLTESQVAL